MHYILEFWEFFYQVCHNISGPDKRTIYCVIMLVFFYNEIPTRDSSSFAAWYYTLPVRIFFSGGNFWSTWKKTPTWRIFFTRFPKLKQLGSSMTIIKKLDMCKILDKCKINHCSVHVYDAYSTILHIIWPRDV